MKSKKKNEDLQKTKFYIEASVALAKASIFLELAEADISRQEFISASINAYYCMFHLSLTLMWWFADQLPEKTRVMLDELRKNGMELPSSDITHRSVEKFLCDGQFKLKNKAILCRLFRRAQELREFTNYGPRVTWPSGTPVVGPCHFTPNDIAAVVSELRVNFHDAISLAAPQTGLEGTLAPIVIHQATELLKRPEFPFVNWVSSGVCQNALSFLETLKSQLPRKK